MTVLDEAGQLALTGPFSIHVFAMPTTPGKGVQRILGRMAAGGNAGYALEIAGGRLRLTVGDGSATQRIESDTPLHPSCWYSFGATYDPVTGEAAIYQAPVRNSYNSLLSPIVAMPGRSLVRGAAPIAPGDGSVSFVIAGDPAAGSHFNGKLDSPKVWGRALGEDELDALTAGGPAPAAGLAAHWDFSDGIGAHGVPTDHVRDVGGHDLSGVCVNQPARGMTGWNWDCSEECYRHAPQLYGAIHFHDDDLDECGWETDIALTIPDDMRSGVYALRIQQGEAVDRIPFFVIPPRGTATAKIAFLVPTASYLAYANDHIVHDVPVAQSILGHTSCISEQDFYLYGNLDLGLSTYDSHSDGSGVCFSSSRRPIMNMRPDFRHATGSVWQFPADLHLVDWLEEKGY